MKTFSDPNTKREQERLKNSTFIIRVEFFRQYAGDIIGEDAATKSLIVDGDATGIIHAGNTILIPLHDFETVFTVSSVTYNASTDETTIILNTDAFPADITGKQIARRYIVSYGDVERLIEMSPIRFQTEGDVLNEFTAGNVSFLFDNGDGFFTNRNGTGIFDNNDIFWVRIYTGYKNSSDRILYFGGLIDRESLISNREARTFECTAYSHEKELERYPGFLISEPLGRLLKMSGVTLLGVSPSNRTREGVFKLSYQFQKEEIPGVRIKEIDKNTPASVRRLKYRYPNLIRYHDGNWTQVSENSTATLQDASGNTLTIETTNYDIRDREILLFIVTRNVAEISSQGMPKLQFNNGDIITLSSDFTAVYRYDGSNFLDVSADNETQEGFTGFTDSNDILYLFSESPFYGLDIQIDASDLSAQIALEYSAGFNSWSSLNGFSDTTNNLTQDGAILWERDKVAGWRPTTLEIGTPEMDIRNKYAVRIRLSSYNSGSCNLKSIIKRIRLYGADDTMLEISINPELFLTENVEEDIIIRKVNNVWQPCVWYKNLEDRQLLNKVLEAANFSLKDVKELKITSSNPEISIWGQPPYPYYRKRVTALYFDADASRLWIGMEDELWYHENGEFTFVGNLDYTPISIKRLAKDGSGNIQGIAWWDRYDAFELPAGLYSEAAFHVMVFQANTSGIQVQNRIGYNFDYINPCEVMMRKGKYGGTGVENVLGAKHTAGENILIPFPQILKAFSREYISGGSWHFMGAVLYDTDSILSTNVSGSGSFYFGNQWSTNENSGDFYTAQPGHYQILDNNLSGEDFGWICLRILLGNSGFVLWDPTRDKWIVYQMNRDSENKIDNSIKIGHIDVNGTFTQLLDLSDSKHQPLCGIVRSQDIVYMAVMHWEDNAAALSNCTLEEFPINNPLSGSVIWDSKYDPADVNASIYGREEYQTILDLTYNETEQAIHGCMLDRGTFEYHYFVYDMSTDTMHSTQTGSNFTFDKHRQIKNFTLLNGKVYAVIVDKRYGEESSYLIEATYNNSTITLTKIDVINENDFDHAALHSDGNQLFGITGKGILWQYSTQFYPRTEYLVFDRMNFRQIISELAKKFNMIWTIRSNRKILFYQRNDYDGELKLYEYAHIASIQPVRKWQHIYDGVEVNWKSQIDELEGIEEYGSFGWDRKILQIDGRLIQNRHIARFIARQYGQYFTQNRYQIEAEVTSLIQAEERDRFQLVAQIENYDVDRNTWWLLNALTLDPETLLLTIEGIN